MSENMFWQRLTPQERMAGLGLGLGVTAAAALLAGLRSRSPKESFRGKVALITGGSRGLGYALAERLAREGARVVICARNERDLQSAHARLASFGAEVLAISCDVGHRPEVQAIVDQTTAYFGEIDLLINNAGIISVGPIEKQTIDDFREAMDVMFWGMVYPTMAVLPSMLRRRSGRIVNITSIGGKIAVPHLVPYGSAKFAAVGFSEGLGAEMRRKGISVTTVVPGLMRTGSHINAWFKGNPRAEYNWFALSATSPLTSISAKRAARAIVEAARRGAAEVILSLPAQVATRVHGLMPGRTTEVLSLVNDLLPGATGGTAQKYRGRDVETPITRSALTYLGKRAARRYNQLGDRAA